MTFDFWFPSLSPLHKHCRTNRIPSALRTINCEASDGQRVGGDGATQPQVAVSIVGNDLMKQVAFGKGVDEIPVSTHSAPEIAQDPARIVRVIAQDAVI